jgi:hypothetical protein
MAERILDNLVDRLLQTPELRTAMREIALTVTRNERDRMVELLQTGNASIARNISNDGRSALVSSPRRQRGSRAGYGAVASSVRSVLLQLSMDELPNGSGAEHIARVFEIRGDGPNLGQVRAALKTLTMSGDAVRVGRGRYLSREAAATAPAGAEKNPDAGASGRLFNPDNV